MGHWNHRVIEFVEADGSPWRAIHEVHYDDAGRPYAYAENAADVSGESNEELLKTLEWMRAALDKPALVETDFKEAQVDALAAEIAGVLDAEQIAARL
jgi:tetrahydromethanopterin S-methyltransferase subunit H